MKRDWFYRFLRAGVVSALSSAILGCGGVDSGGTGGSSAVGPITGLGSIIVNGVRYDESAAQITDDDGQVVPRSRLKLGVLVTVEGTGTTMLGAERLATAERVRISSDLVGEVQAIDHQGRSVTVLQQSVRVTTATVFDDLLPLGLDSLTQGATIEVYGRVDAATSQYVATRIELRPLVAHHMIRGHVDTVDAMNRLATIGAAQVDFSALPAAEARLVSVGATVRFRLQLGASSGSWRAVAASQSNRTLGDSEEGFLEGRINSFNSISRFEVDGQTVDATNATMPPGSPALGIGTRVSVEGSSRNGILIATSVRIEDDEDSSPEVFELHGTIESLDAGARLLQIGGVAVDYSGSVTFFNGTASDLAVGRQIEVKGTLQADGVGLRAQEIEFEFN